MARKRIGELLVEKGVITGAQLEQSLILHKRTHVKLGAALVQNGHITEEQLVSTLSEALGIATVQLATVVPDWSAVHLLRARFCELNALFPYAIENKGAPNKQLIVALSDPLNGPTLSEIEFTTGLPVSPRLATLSSIHTAIARYYHRTSGPISSAPPLPGKPKPAEEEDVIVMGTALPDEETTPVHGAQAGGALPLKRKITAEFEALFALPSAEEGVSDKHLEKKFWALIRIMARKGLITKDEFAQELEDGEE